MYRKEESTPPVLFRKTVKANKKIKNRPFHGFIFGVCMVGVGVGVGVGGGKSGNDQIDTIYPAMFRGTKKKKKKPNT